MGTFYKGSIEYLELYTVTARILAWIEQFCNKGVYIFCNNQSVVDIINKSSSSYKNCMVLIRMITLQGLKCNVRIYARHRRGIHNKISDAISRGKFDKRNGFKCRSHSDTPTITANTEVMDEVKLIAGKKKRRCKGMVANSTDQEDFRSISSLSDATRISTQQVMNFMKSLKMKQNRDSTMENYIVVWRLFNKFLVKLDELPEDWEERASLFYGYLIHRNKEIYHIQILPFSN